MSRAGEIAIGIFVILVGLLVLGLGGYYTYLLLKAKKDAASIKPEFVITSNEWLVTAKSKAGIVAAKERSKTKTKGRTKNKAPTKVTV